MFHTFLRLLLTALFVANATFAAQLLSNSTCAVVAGPVNGEVWALTCGASDSANGFSMVSIGNSGGTAVVQNIQSVTFPKNFTGVHDNILVEYTGELRRTVVTRVGSLVISQGFALDSTGLYTKPTALLRTSATKAISVPVQAANLDSNAVALWPKPVEVAAHDIGLDKGGLLWLARGPWGITRTVVAPPKWDTLDGAAADTVPLLLLDVPNSRLVSTMQLDSVDSASIAPIWALAIDSTHGTLWLGSERGLWKGHRDSLALHRLSLGGIDSLRISGIWMSESGATLIVESSHLVTSKSSSHTVSSLWRSTNGGNTFEALNLPYDSLDISVSAAAFLGSEIWLSTHGIGSMQSGLLRIGASGPLQWPDSLRLPNRSESSNYLWGMETGVLDRDVIITSICTFPLGAGLGLAISTLGGGIAVSADSGTTWKPILNQKVVQGKLGEIRMVPSVLRYDGATSQVAYRLTEDSKITIEVFSYDMKKVRTIINKAARSADPIRSTHASTDFWDGRDQAGNRCTVGIYYVKVSDNHGHQGFGKVMWLGGRP